MWPFEHCASSTCIWAVFLCEEVSGVALANQRFKNDGGCFQMSPVSLDLSHTCNLSASTS